MWCIVFLLMAIEEEHVFDIKWRALQANIHIKYMNVSKNLLKISILQLHGRLDVNCTYIISISFTLTLSLTLTHTLYAFGNQVIVISNGSNRSMQKSSVATDNCFLLPSWFDFSSIFTVIYSLNSTTYWQPLKFYIP